jgi:hypothetical protein
MPNYMFKMTGFWKKNENFFSFLHHDKPLCCMLLIMVLENKHKHNKHNNYNHIIMWALYII